MAATGIQNVIVYAGVAQASNDGKGMQVYEGRRIVRQLMLDLFC